MLGLVKDPAVSSITVFLRFPHPVGVEGQARSPASGYSSSRNSCCSHSPPGCTGRSNSIRSATPSHRMAFYGECGVGEQRLCTDTLISFDSSHDPRHDASRAPVPSNIHQSRLIRVHHPPIAAPNKIQRTNKPRAGLSVNPVVSLINRAALKLRGDFDAQERGAQHHTGSRFSWLPLPPD